MSALVWFAAGPDRWRAYEGPLATALADAGVVAEVTADRPDPSQVDYIVHAPGHGPEDFGPFTRCKAVLSLWAGVERVVTNPTLTQPLARMVDPDLTAGMVEWVTGHVLRHHLGLDRLIVNPDRRWDPTCPPLARERKVTILGLGALGQASARALQGLGFPVTGWSRTPKAIPGLRTLAGLGELGTALAAAQILILLLPRTTGTEDLIDTARLAMLPDGAVILNPGRGHLIEDAALLAALDSSHIAHATLDTFRTEPLPRDHPFWAHPQVTVSPHVAAETRPASAARVIAENIRRGEAGEPFLHLVDRRRGY